MNDLTKSSCVQSGVNDTPTNSICQRDLDSVPQLRFCARLNTSRKARAACGAVGTRIASTTAKSCGGDFPRTSREPASCNRSAETSAARPWAVLVSAVLCCGPSYPWKWNTQRTYRTEMENVSALNGAAVIDGCHPDKLVKPLGLSFGMCIMPSVRHSDVERRLYSEHCSFLFLSHL